MSPHRSISIGRWLVPCGATHKEQRSQVLTNSDRSWEQRQLDTLMHEIAERLRPICARMPAEEFDQLVERIALVQRKWQRMDARNFLGDVTRQKNELE